jgi:hypothetical protein
VTAAARLAALAGVGVAAAVAFVATQWLGGNRGAPDDVGRVGIRDVVVARDAQVHQGRLEGCNASSCRLGERSFERDALAFVGLGVESATPPPVENPGRDELHLRGGGVVHESLAQIDDERVFAGARRFERGEVAWVYLAPPREEPEPGGPTERPPETPPEPQQPPPPPEDSPPLPTPRPPPAEPAQACPDDQPLGAWIWLRNTYQDFRPPHCRGVETQVVRFRLEPDPGTQLPGAAIALAYSAQALEYSVSTDGCFDAPESEPYETCNAEGAHVEGTLSLSAENLGYAKFFPLEPQLGFQYPTPPTQPFELTVQCLHHPTGLRSEHTVDGFNGISISPGECAYPNRDCNDYCVAPTVCKDPGSGPQDCFLKPDRFAVVPFEGALVDGPEREERGLCVLPGDSQVRWRVCCGCAETGPPPDFGPGRRDPCGPPDPQRALLDTALEQQKAILRPLGELLREQQRIQAQAKQWEGDFAQATRDCRLWGAARFLVGLLASGGAPGAGAGAFRAAEPIPATKEFWNFLAMAEKVNAGDPSWLLPNHEFGGWASVEDAWDGFTIAYGALGPSSPQSLREGLQQCGAPTLEGVLDGAYEYLRLLEQLPALGEQMSRILNDSRAKDQEIFDLWRRWLEACREYERCRGGDPSRCDPSTDSGVSEGGTP